MFTGIIEEIGTVRSVTPGRDAATLKIGASAVLEDVRLGDSIAVNGVCVTVTGFSREAFTADLMPETLKATSLATVKSGTPVNLERALRADSRLGGHIVSGHIDCTAMIRSKRTEGNAIYLDLTIPNEFSAYLIQKGSVALDGTSLTVFEAREDSITVSLVPHTQAVTILGSKKPGDRINLECDILAKYAERMLQPFAGQKNGVTFNTLQKNGFA
ncbi:riboflavin synthase alpha chain [Bhargavaea ginsengi]|uniref:Riboflavin synthase n=1 Tax=Bhargavaea ginsengi TaxID=426757 RepID=A0A1H6SI11_9BACL|nr:riboflavin synthase [Bhargavaea ginsengi]SEI63405.1 riboflavin synthase alpha chain [Bhargavaea ginsengi]